MVEFHVTTPIDTLANVTHLFYWDGDALYSCTMESKEMVRSTQIDNIIN